MKIDKILRNHNNGYRIHFLKINILYWETISQEVQRLQF